MHVFFHRPGVLKDPQIMSGVWLVIFYIVCLILARQVCVSSTNFSFFCQNKHFFSDYAHLKINELTIKMFLGLFLIFFLSGRVGLPCGLPVGSLLQDRERGDGDYGERQQAASTECAATSRGLLLHRQNYSQPGEKKNTNQHVIIDVFYFPHIHLTNNSYYTRLTKQQDENSKQEKCNILKKGSITIICHHSQVVVFVF